MRTRTTNKPKAGPIEWPTLAVAGGIYLLFGLLTWHHDLLPWWLLLIGGGFITCLHGSLQHEVVHGHPTGSPWLNEALVFPSLWLWMPFRTYRRVHLEHHYDPALTDPLEDPESYYVTAEAWERMGPLSRAFLWAHNTASGRLLLGPLRSCWRLLTSEIGPLLRGRRDSVMAWSLHVLGAGMVIVWVSVVCDMPLWLYVLTFAYPGLSLTLLRSFLEHQARPSVGERIVLVEAGPVMSLLFLNNNLHALHHAEPGTAWYDLPARYRLKREQLLAENGGYRYRNYLEILARYLFWPKEPPVHPFKDTAVLVTAQDQQDFWPVASS